MQRVRSSVLTKNREDLWCLQDKPFSGLVYNITDNGLIQEVQVMQQGVNTGTTNDWLDLPNGGLRVDATHLQVEEDYGPMLFRGAPFTGIGYFFDGENHCVLEEAYQAGHPSDTARRRWYASGAWQLQLQGNDGVGWFEDGRLQYKGAGDAVFLNLVTRDDGRLGAIVLFDHNLFDVTTIQQLTYSDELLLIGPAINTELLRTLRDHTTLRSVPQLQLIDSSVGPEGIDVLVSLDGLKDLTLTNNPFLLAEHVQQIRERRPDCTVHYEQPEAILDNE